MGMAGIGFPRIFKLYCFVTQPRPAFLQALAHFVQAFFDAKFGRKELNTHEMAPMV
jgi:hypothetical protein